MKLTCKDDRDEISLPFKYLKSRRVVAYHKLKEIGFFEVDQGPTISLEEMKELLPYIQNFLLTEGRFTCKPRYEILPVADKFVIQRDDGMFFALVDGKGCWCIGRAELWDRTESAEAMVYKLEKEDSKR